MSSRKQTHARITPLNPHSSRADGNSASWPANTHRRTRPPISTAARSMPRSRSRPQRSTKASCPPAARVFTVKHFVCSQTGGKQWVSGGTFHLRGLSNSGQLVHYGARPVESQDTYHVSLSGSVPPDSGW